MISGDLHNESLEVENASEVNEESGPVPETYLWFVFVGGPLLRVHISKWPWYYTFVIFVIEIL